MLGASANGARSDARGLVVKAIAPSGRLGYYLSGTEIGLAVENLATWSHEMVHAADDRLGTITHGGGQRLDNEIVAELGGAILLECLGHTVESDRGGAYEYIESYCQKHSRDLLSVCSELLERTCSAVELILATAEELSVKEEEALVGAPHSFEGSLREIPGCTTRVSPLRTPTP
jgi:hypothetical protein